MSDKLSLAGNLATAQGEPLSKEETKYLEYVAQWPHTWGESMAILLLQRSLNRHAIALKAAAVASEKHAKSLALATWILAGATIILACVEWMHR